MADEQLYQVLQEKFGFTSFRPGQEEVIKALLAGKDTLAVLPTGAGKSLLYQLPAYVLPGITLIVSPLISLMQDQVDRLRRRGERRVVMLNGQLTGYERAQVLQHLTSYKFVFTSPETLASSDVVTALQQVQLSLLVVDEAHCISQWGPDFRPEYLLLKKIRTTLAKPLTLLLTATATPTVRHDILEKLGLDESEIYQVVRSVNRPNILMAVTTLANQEEKDHQLLQLVQKFYGSGIIYFASRKLATQMANQLAKQTGKNVAAYHAGVSPVERFRIQEQFMNNQLQIICATSAFGMGIDKNDIRFVIHYHMPSNLENYVQEIGRAGRDGRQSIAVLLYAPGDEQIQRQLTRLDLPPEELLSQVQNGELPASVMGEQGEIFEFYLNHHYQPQQVLEVFKRRQQQLKEELRIMLDYVMQDSCRRSYILQYFGETPIVVDQLCCDVDDPTWEEQEILPASSPKDTSGYLTWQQRLARLIKIAKS